MAWWLMISRNRLEYLGAVLAAASCLGCHVEPDVPRTSIQIDGSSTVFKLSQAIAEEFEKRNREVHVKVDKSGTGGGFKKFVEGTIDICDASRPIQESEMAKCKANGVEYIELPVCFDAVTVAVNIENDWCDSMTTEELKKLWEPDADAKITKWSQVRKGWPEREISLHGAGHDSGTFEYFTEAIVEKKNASRSDYSASEDDNTIVMGIAGDESALGYLPFAYYQPHAGKTLKAVKIDAGKGPIAPSVETVKDASYAPLSRPLFIYVNRKAAERPEVKQFIEYYLAEAGKVAQKVKYIPLTDKAYEMGAERFGKLQTGTGFGGHSEFGLPLEEILQREPQS